MAIAYNTSVVRHGLVLHLDAANTKSYPGSGTAWNDLSGNGNNGTLVNGVGYSTNNNGYLTFDGVNDEVQISNSASINPLTNTLICWARSNTENWNNFGFLMSKRDVFVMHPDQNTKDVQYYYRLNNVWQSAMITVTNITIWNMYACTWNGTSITAYLNGSFINSQGRTGPLNTSDTGIMTVGSDDGTGRYMNGNISHVMMYNRALNDTEIRQNFEATRGRYGI